MQEEIIQSALDKRDTLALLPTGGGKSICFQVPALVMSGMCLVISPLIALMKDQVENLKQRGIAASAIHSGMHLNEIESVISNAVHNKLKFLYVSPERLETDMILLNIARMKVNLLAVDEAHCISQWGYDFRPSYLNIIKIRQHLPNIPLLALTATATPIVITDIQEKLGFKTQNVFHQSFERKNLTYVVVKEEDKMGRLLKVIHNIGGSGIIYVRNRRKTNEISDILSKLKIRSDFYHAGLEPAIRNKRQEAWMSGKIQVIVATNAFGMGIDKPNVRFVVHLDIPDTIEAYFQEAGRAGRDGKNSYAVLMYDNTDVAESLSNLKRQYPEIKYIRNVYHALGNYLNLAIGSGKDTTHEFNINQFCTNYNLNSYEALQALKFLEKDGYLFLQEVAESESKIHVRVSKEDLYKFQVEHIKFDKFIKTILRSYSGLFSEYVKIHEADLARRTELKEEQVISTLTQLDKYKILVYKPKSHLPRITFLQERMDGKNIRISEHNYSDRLKTGKQRLDAMLSFIQNSNRCRSLQLLAYFGEDHQKRCGKCDVCIERNKIELSEFEFDTVIEKIKPILLKSPTSIKNLSVQLKHISEDRIIKVVQWLLDNGKVEYDKQKLLSWKNK